MTKSELKIICDRVFLQKLPDRDKTWTIEESGLNSLVLKVIAEIRGNDFNELMLHSEGFDLPKSNGIINITMFKFFVMMQMIINTRVRQMKSLIKDFELE